MAEVTLFCHSTNSPLKPYYPLNAQRERCDLTCRSAVKGAGLFGVLRDQTGTAGVAAMIRAMLCAA